MKVTTVEDDGKAAKLLLSGKLDILGAEAVALPLATLSGARQGLIVDMSEVTFLASIGIRHLVSAAKALSRRKGRIVLLKPIPMVEEVIKTSGLDDFLPMVASDAEADIFFRG